MRIRSLTTGAALPTEEAARASLIMRLGTFSRAGRAALEDAGFTVQTTRLSTQPIERWLPPNASALRIVSELGQMCAVEDIFYWSLGTMQTESFDPDLAGVDVVQLEAEALEARLESGGALAETRDATLLLSGIEAITALFDFVGPAPCPSRRRRHPQPEIFSDDARHHRRRSRRDLTHWIHGRPRL